jgi:hypothetical protein
MWWYLGVMVILSWSSQHSDLIEVLLDHPKSETAAGSQYMFLKNLKRVTKKINPTIPPPMQCTYSIKWSFLFCILTPLVLKIYVHLLERHKNRRPSLCVWCAWWCAHNRKVVSSKAGILYAPVEMWCEKSIQHQPTGSAWELGVLPGANIHWPFLIHQLWIRWDFPVPTPVVREMVSPPAPGLTLHCLNSALTSWLCQVHVLLLCACVCVCECSEH